MDPLLPVQTVPKPKSQKPTKSFIMFSLISLCVTVGLVNQSENPNPDTLQYGVIIDAGSSGTRVHVFGYLMESGIPVVYKHTKHEEDIALSSYANAPASASELIELLVKFVEIEVPEDRWEESEIRLMATAGMRLVDPKVGREILQVTRKALKASKFKFHYSWASIISGFDEGLYAWVIVNYAIGSLGNDEVQTSGIVELGGASAQVAFVPIGPVPPEFQNMTRRIFFGSSTYNLYSHSFLNFGVDEALKTLRNSLRDSDEDEPVNDPCTPSGYNLNTNANKNSSGLLVEGNNRFTASLVAAGDYQQCRAKTLSILKEGNDECSKNCYIGSTFTPILRGKFFALAGFFYTSKFFKLEEKHWLSEMSSAGTEFCGKQWSELQRENRRINKQYLSKYCFSSAYIVSMLQDVFGFSDESITYANKAGKSKLSLDWAMGAFILTYSTRTSDSSQKLAYSNIPIFKI